PRPTLFPYTTLFRSEVRIRKTLPAIAERLSTLHQSITRDINEWGTKTKEQLTNINATLEDLFEGRVSLTLHSARAAVRPVTAVSAYASDAAAMTISAIGSGGDGATAPTHVSTTSPHLPSGTTLPLVDIPLPSRLRLPSLSP